MTALVLHCDVCKWRVSRRSAHEAVLHRIETGEPDRSGAWLEAKVRGATVRACSVACTEKHDRSHDNDGSGWTYVVEQRGRAIAC